MFSRLLSLLGLGSQHGRRRQRRKATNTRVHRHSVDKNPDTPKTREVKREQRRAAGLKLAVGLTCAASVVALANSAFQETVIRNPRFALRQVYVEKTSGLLTPAKIIQATGLTEGVNLLTIDLRAVRERLLKVPGIADASVKRDFEGKLTVSVTQRQPIAWVRCDPLNWQPRSVRRSLLVDAQGIALPADSVLPEYATLPVIHDDTIDQITPGQPIEWPRFKTMLNMAKWLATREAMDGARLTALSAPNKFALVAKFADDAEVTFSHDALESQQERYVRLRETARERDWKFESVNLVAGKNTPVRLKTTRS